MFQALPETAFGEDQDWKIEASTALCWLQRASLGSFQSVSRNTTSTESPSTTSGSLQAAAPASTHPAGQKTGESLDTAPWYQMESSHLHSLPSQLQV